LQAGGFLQKKPRASPEEEFGHKPFQLRSVPGAGEAPRSQDGRRGSSHLLSWKKAKMSGLKSSRLELNSLFN
jgi:hypothetical protein